MAVVGAALSGEEVEGLSQAVSLQEAAPLAYEFCSWAPSKHEELARREACVLSIWPMLSLHFHLFWYFLRF